MVSDYQFLFNCFQEELGSEETFFAYPYLPLWYFLSKRRNPTSFLAAMEGHHSDKQLERLVQELEMEAPPLILYGALGTGPFGVSRKEGFNHPLSLYMVQKYRILYSLPYYQVQVLQRVER